VPFNLLMRGVVGSSDTYPRLSRGKTDGNGVANFSGLIPGRFDILGVAAGNGYIEAKNTAIAPGAMKEPWVVKLAPGGTLNISAHDAAGKAVGGATMLFTRIGEGVTDGPRTTPGPEMQIYLARPTFATRDGDGLLTVSDVAPGRYTVTAAYVGAAEVPVQTIEVTSGGTVTADFKMVPPTGVAVSVNVTDAKGAVYANSDVNFIMQQTAAPAASAITPAPTAAVVAFSARMDRRAHTDGNGAVVLYPVPPGTYQITARRSGETSANRTATAAQAVEIKEGGAALSFQLP